MDFKPPALMRFMRRGVSSKGQQSKGSAARSCATSKPGRMKRANAMSSRNGVHIANGVVRGPVRCDENRRTRLTLSAPNTRAHARALNTFTSSHARWSASWRSGRHRANDVDVLAEQRERQERRRAGGASRGRARSPGPPPGRRSVVGSVVDDDGRSASAPVLLLPLLLLLLLLLLLILDDDWRRYLDARIRIPSPRPRARSRPPGIAAPRASAPTSPRRARRRATRRIARARRPKPLASAPSRKPSGSDIAARSDPPRARGTDPPRATSRQTPRARGARGPRRGRPRASRRVLRGVRDEEQSVRRAPPPR